MDTTQQKIDDIWRGSLLQTAGGFVIADLDGWTAGSGDGRVEPQQFLYDTDGRRHFPNPTDGTLTVGIATFRTQEYGKVPGKGTQGHALLNMVPGEPPAGLCPASRNLGNKLSVWSSGTALTGVTCRTCRKMIGLVNTGAPRQSNGI
jgi:hypothetical protein